MRWFVYNVQYTSAYLHLEAKWDFLLGAPGLLEAFLIEVNSFFLLNNFWNDKRKKNAQNATKPPSYKNGAVLTAHSIRISAKMCCASEDLLIQVNKREKKVRIKAMRISMGGEYSELEP